MQEYPKSQCLYHPLETITNFCKQKSCLMPLCPTCICSHMETHLSEGKSNPKFDNINEAFNSMSSEIRRFNERFNDSQIQLGDLERTINSHKKGLSDLIFATKIQVRDMVEKGFDELEKELEGLIGRDNERRGLHVQEGLELLKKGIGEVAGKLEEMRGDLKTEKGLGSLITFNHETRANIQKYQEMISKDIRNNMEYYPIANVNSGVINQIKHCLTQLISVKFNLPSEFSKQPIQPHTKTQGNERSLAVKSPKLNISINDSLEKFSGLKSQSTKTPLARTCINSLRSSFGTIKPSPITQTKSPKVNPNYLKKVMSPISGNTSPINMNKLLETKVASSLQGVKRRALGEPGNENRF